MGRAHSKDCVRLYLVSVVWEGFSKWVGADMILDLLVCSARTCSVYCVSVLKECTPDKLTAFLLISTCVRKTIGADCIIIDIAKPVSASV